MCLGHCTVAASGLVSSLRQVLPICASFFLTPPLPPLPPHAEVTLGYTRVCGMLRFVGAARNAASDQPFTTSQKMTIITLCYCNLCGAMFASLLAPFFPTQVKALGNGMYSGFPPTLLLYHTTITSCLGRAQCTAFTRGVTD